jgi:malonyl CoA-acyl carrier protein transacylase
MRFLLASGVGRFVEVGPGNVLTGLLGRIEPSAKICGIHAPADMERADTL